MSTPDSVDTAARKDADQAAVRTVILLAICQGLSQSASIIIGVVSALTGLMLAEDKSLATLAVAMMMVGVMVATVPASLLMKRIGRRAGFTIGQLCGATSALISIYAIFSENFWLFVAAGPIYGIHTAFFHYYRFAAADAATDAYRSRAISFVLTGGVAAAILGPELAKLTRDLFAPVVFAGSFAAIFVLCLVSVTVIQFIKIPRPTAKERSETGRPLSEIARQPAFAVAILSAMLGYGAMSLVMTATPLAVTAHDHSFSDAAFIIQWHVLGMFTPSFFTGHLIHRFGALNIILTGALLIMSCIAVNLTGVGLVNFWFGLVALGVGWNFMFIGGTTLLTTTYRPEERAKVQAVNDFCVFGSVATGALSSGVLHALFGWDGVNLGIVLPIMIAFAAASWLRLRPVPVAVR